VLRKGRGVVCVWNTGLTQGLNCGIYVKRRHFCCLTAVATFLPWSGGDGIGGGVIAAAAAGVIHRPPDATVLRRQCVEALIA
ncbi:hypothetical protein, partial [Specibacter sp. NPDC078692]|uniref:hypothetical protein n=1 Tax=Specibacter sp. NPDC078692 TaxID=3155818 RepID=UPI003417E21F